MPSIASSPSSLPFRLSRRCNPLNTPAMYCGMQLFPTPHPKQRSLVCMGASNAASTSTSAPEEPPSANPSSNRSHETDYVIIGSGIGGLCCAALLARYGYAVTVLESHYLPGGAAHSFDIQVRMACSWGMLLAAAVAIFQPHPPTNAGLPI